MGLSDRGRRRVASVLASSALFLSEHEPLPLAIPPRLRVQAVEIFSGIRLLRVAGHPALAGHELGEPAKLAAFCHARPNARPGHLIVQRWSTSAVAGEQLTAAVGALLDVAVWSVVFARGGPTIGAAFRGGAH